MSWGHLGLISHCPVSRIDTTSARMQSNFLTQATTDVTAPGQTYETRNVEVGDVSYIGFVNAPQSLRELYRQGLRFEDRDFYVYEDERYSYTDA